MIIFIIDLIKKKKNAKQYTKITAKALLNSPSELTSG